MKLYIYFNAGVKESAIHTDNFSFVENYYNNLSHADNYIKCVIPFDVDISNYLKQEINTHIRAVIKKDDGSAYFSGYIKQDASFGKASSLDPITIEIVSPSFLFNKTYKNNSYMASQTLRDNVQSILSYAGVSSYVLSNLPNKTVSLVSIAEGETVASVLQELLLEFGYTYDFDSDGKFICNPLFNSAPSSITQVFKDGRGGNLLGKVQQKIKPKEFDGVFAKFDVLTYGENETIFSDNSSRDIAPNSYIGDDENGVYFEYDTPNKAVKYITEINDWTVKTDYYEIDKAHPVTSELEGQITNYNARALAMIKNKTDATLTIKDIQIKGSGYFVTSTGATKETQGEKIKDVSLKYIFNREDAESYVSKLTNYYRYSNFVASLNSKADYPIGSFCRVDVEYLGAFKGRIIQKNRKINTDVITYTIEAISDYIPAVLRTDFSESGTANITRDEVENLIDTVVTPVTVRLYKRSATSMATTGISGNAYFNFINNSLSWGAGSTSNGWTKEYPSGTDPVYITEASFSGNGNNYPIPDNLWSEPVIYVKNGEDGLNSAEVYNIIPSYNIVTRYQDGTLSSDKIKFSFYKASETDRGEVSVYYVVSVSTLNNIWSVYQRGSGTSVEINVGDFVGIKCNIYLDNTQDMPLDSESVAIVSEGSGAVVVNLSNANVSLLADEDGNIEDYSNTMTYVYVLCGSHNLNYGDPEKRGFFTVDVLTSGVIESQTRAIAFEGEYVNEYDEVYVDEDGNAYIGIAYFELPAIVGMTANQGSRRVTVRGTSYDGSAFELVTTQTITKIRNGTDGKSVNIVSVEYAVSDTIAAAPTSWTTTRPTEIPDGYYLWSKVTYYDGASQTEYAEYSFTRQGQKGSDGTNSATVILYQRASSKPSYPSATLKYYFEKPPRTEWKTDGSSNGWLFNKPPVTSQKLPLWEIRSTALSNTDYDEIAPTQWGTIEQTQLDNGLTEAETEAIALLKAQDVSEEMKKEILKSLIPVFSIVRNDCLFSVEDNHEIKIEQTKAIEISCKQNGIDYPFEVERVILPNYLRYSVDNNIIYVTAEAGKRIEDSTIRILVKCSPLESLLYSNENGETYSNGTDEYGLIDYADQLITREILTVTIKTIIGGQYHNTVTDVTYLPVNVLVGDYITWGGTKTQSKKSADGVFIPSMTYTWDGMFWRKESNNAHLSVALSDVLAIKDADLQNNNSDAWQYLDHLTANSIFTDLLTASLINADKIIAKEEIVDRFESIGHTTSDLADSIDTVDLYSKKIVEVLSENPDETIIEGGKIKTSLLQVNLIVSSYFSEGNTIQQNNVAGLITALEGKLEDSDVAKDIKDYQTIYCIIDIKANVPSAPTSYLYEDETTWKLTKPSYAENKVIYSCIQYLTYDNSYSHTPVVVDYDTLFDVANGYLRTKLIDANTIRAGLVTTSELSTQKARIDDIVSGTIVVGASSYSSSSGTSDYSASSGSATDSTNATNVSGGSISGMNTGSGTSVAIHSEDWTSSASTTGFGILKNGNAYFNDIHARGVINATSGTFSNGTFDNITLDGSFIVTDHIFYDVDSALYYLKTAGMKSSINWTRLVNGLFEVKDSSGTTVIGLLTHALKDSYGISFTYILLKGGISYTEYGILYFNKNANKFEITHGKNNSGDWNWRDVNSLTHMELWGNI